MKAAGMVKRIAEASPRDRARITAAVYLLYFLAAILATGLVGPHLIVYGDAVNVFSYACYIAVTLFFYDLFKPVNTKLSLLAALFSLVGCVVGILGVFNLAPATAPFAFFGPYCLLIGYLILRSTFLPPILGVLMAFAGVGWLAFNGRERGMAGTTAVTPLQGALSRLGRWAASTRSTDFPSRANGAWGPLSFWRRVLHFRSWHPISEIALVRPVGAVIHTARVHAIKFSAKVAR